MIQDWTTFFTASPSQKINYPDQEKWATTPTPRPGDSPPTTRASSTTAPSKASPTILLRFLIYRLSRLSVSRRRSPLSVPPAVLLYLPSTITTTTTMDTKPSPVSLPPHSTMIHKSFLFLYQFQFQFQFQAQDFVLMWLVWFRLCCCWGTTCKRTKASLLWYWDRLDIVSWFSFTLIQSIFLLVCFIVQFCVLEPWNFCVMVTFDPVLAILRNVGTIPQNI